MPLFASRCFLNGSIANGRKQLKVRCLWLTGTRETPNLMMMSSFPSVQPVQYMQKFCPLILFPVIPVRVRVRVRLSDDALESLLVPLDLYIKISNHLHTQSQSGRKAIPSPAG